MTAQTDFLKRCKNLGLHDGKLSDWLDEIESLRQQLAEAKSDLFDLRKHADALGRYSDCIEQQLADARRTAEYWKAEHLAGNEQLADSQRQVKLLLVPKEPTVGWTHSCPVLCLDGVELWIDRCPHCGKPSPKGLK